MAAAEDRRRRARGWAWRCWLLGALACGLPASAHAYQCERLKTIYGGPTGPSLRWPHTTASDGSLQPPEVTWYTQPVLTTKLDAQQALARIGEAFAVWQQVSTQPGVDKDSCELIAPAKAQTTGLRFRYGGTQQQNFVGYNYLMPEANYNMVIFRDDAWPHENSQHASSIALTFATTNAITGACLDADIEINSHNFALSTSRDAPAVGSHDLMSLIVHEVGHMIGFGHSDQPLAAMFAQAATQETHRRRLSCDDVSLLTFRYPIDGPTLDCGPDNSAKTCGDCQPPSRLKNQMQVRIHGADTGLQPTGCQAAAPGGWLAAAAAALVAGRLPCCRRRPTPRGHRLPRPPPRRG